LQSGYGAVAELFSADHVRANLTNYAAALWDTERGFPLIGLAAPLIAPARQRALVGLMVAIAVTIAGVYMLYRPFPEWWYLRFFLPALVPLSVLACAVVAWTVARVAALSLGLPVVVAVLLAWFQLATPATAQALDMQRLERRFRTTGELVRNRFGESSIFIAVWQSGTLRYHAGREAVLWDSLAPNQLDDAVRWLSTQGLEPFILTEEWEESEFRSRFAAVSTLGALDWPPRLEIERQVKIYRPADRSRYRTGADVRTEFILPR
jgi:hypothetical protein